MNAAADRRNPTVARTQAFTHAYGLAQDIGAAVHSLPRGHVKRRVVARMLREYRREEPAAARFYLRRGRY